MLLLAFFSYLLPLMSFARHRYPLISPPAFFYTFFLMAYGPHTLGSWFLDASVYLPDDVDGAYQQMVTLANLGIAFGLEVGNLLVPAAVRRQMLSPAFARAKPVSALQRATPLLLLAGIFSLFFLSLDAPNFSRTIETLKVIFRTSEYGYSEVRRILFKDALITIAQNYVRNGIAPIIVTLIWIQFFYRARGVAVRLMLVGAFVLVYVSAILALNKLPTLYSFLSIASGLYLFRKGAVVNLKRRLPLMLGGVAILFVMLEVLYRLQYSAAIEAGQVQMSDIHRLLLYRPFIGQADMLRFWVDQWPSHQEYIGLRSFRPVASLFGLDYYQPTQELPLMYQRRGSLTSWQTGFMGSAYASWGMAGVLAYGFLCSSICCWQARLIHGLRHRDIAAAATAVCSLTSFHLCSAETTVALLSGSVLIAPLFAKLLDVNFAPRRRTANRTVQYRVNVRPASRDTSVTPSFDVTL